MNRRSLLQSLLSLAAAPVAALTAKTPPKIPVTVQGTTQHSYSYGTIYHATVMDDLVAEPPTPKNFHWTQMNNPNKWG